MAEVLQLSDIVKLTRLPAHTVRQWSIGRPYRIVATVRESSQRGVPKLFSPGDALKFMVAAQLTRDGFTSSVINRALQRFEAHAETLAITSGRVSWVNIIPFDAWAQKEMQDNISVYTLDMARLRDELNQRIAKKKDHL